MQFDDSTMSTSMTEKQQDGDAKGISTPNEISKMKMENQKAKEMHLLKIKHSKE